MRVLKESLDRSVYFVGTTHVDLHDSLKRLPVENDTLFKKLNCANKAAHASLDQICKGVHSV